MTSCDRAPAWSAGAFVLMVVGISGAARAKAPTTRECLDANERAQALREQGKLLEARLKLRICAAQSCPGPVRTDCSNWLSEVQAAIPTVVLDAKDVEGRDIGDVKVTIDGNPQSERPNGRAIELDPGTHSFVFEAPGVGTATEKAVILEGKKYQTVTATLGQPPGAPPLIVTPVAPPPPVARSQEGLVASPESRAPSVAVEAPAGVTRWPAYVSFGVGGAGLVAAGIAGGIALSERNQCDASGHCPSQTVIDSAYSAAHVSDVAAVVAAVGIGAGIAFLIWPPTHGAQVAVGVSPRSVAIAVSLP